jgi:hypothetical protein
MNRSFFSPAMIKRALAGAALGLALITLFIWGVPTKPGWSAYWKIRPMVIVPIACAGGLAFSCLLDGFRKKGGWKAAMAILASILVFIIALWMGTVLGLDGTLWN